MAESPDGKGALAVPEAAEARVLEIVSGLALELGGPRAQRAVTPDASLERDIGLGSLERVELLLRLEAAFGVRLGEELLRLDTPAALARAVGAGVPEEARTAPGRTALLQPARDVAPEQARTLHEVLWLRAQSEPDRPHVYMREDDGREHTITYGALHAQAAAVAAGLHARGVKPGATVALMLPTGADFLRCFQGILLARAVPVPIYPPLRLDRLEEYGERQSAILRNAGVTLLVTIPKALGIGALLRARVPSLAHVVSPDEIAAAAAPARPDGDGADLAFIQYTSGSTGTPKGVALTHDNLLANIRAITTALALRPTDVGASWLPLYHDMGLIGSWLFCLYSGVPIDIQSPLAFLARPERWLWTIHKRRATLSAAPNFAYELCLRKVTDAAIEGLDLSSWRCALNGAEPVNPDTLERFAQRFGPYGFRREALMPVYGLAENAVGLCAPPPGRGPRVDRVAREPFARARRAVPAAEDDRSALRFVGVGTAMAHHEVRIVDDGGDVVPSRQVGRITFRGPSMTAGYYRRPEATAAISLPGGWLDTGDLGYEADGEIFVTGRIKDLIIKAGRNLVPQEIEEAAGAVPGIRKGCVAAFGVADPRFGTESLVVAAETRVIAPAERDALIAAVTERVADAVGVPPDLVQLLPPGAIPKTSSGKIQRAAAREMHASGRLGRRTRTSWRTTARLLLATLAAAIRPRAAALRQIAYTAYVALASALVLVLLLPGLLVLSGRPLRRLARVCARVLLRLVSRRIEVVGLENLPAHRPLLLACNHTSYLDVVALNALLPVDIVFVAKQEVRTWPLLGRLVRRSGHPTVDRLDSQQSVADAASIQETIAGGQSVLFFPEGTFATAAGLRPFRLGTFKTAVEAGLPVVPVALQGLRTVLRPGSWLLRPPAPRLEVAPPVAAAGTDWRAIVDLRDRVASAIAARCGEPRLDLVASGLAGLTGPDAPEE
jgi:1-acyl-sn-glycerol-3-phosphate acyltransferase